MHFIILIYDFGYGDMYERYLTLGGAFGLAMEKREK
jgi:hypothetical protein